jgi:hypothetical protein
MKHTITLLLLFISSICFAQEICDNAIDDDSDGLVDLNDPDCACKNQQKVNSIIPNASFEDKNDCPANFSELYKCIDWVQATGATTDYINTCDFLYDGMETSPVMPFPDGDAVIGAIFTDMWKEYVGTCLKTPLEANTSYQLTFDIGEIGGTGGDGIYCKRDAEPVNVTLFGSTACNLPLETYLSPNIIDPSWVVLGSATYQPVEKWGLITINFTPQSNITSIMLGAPEVLPTGYDGQALGDCLVMLLFDNLILNESSAFGTTIIETGSYCTNDLVLNANHNINFSDKATYQWYKNGIAIIGATKKSYSISSLKTSFANYNVKITDGSDCYTSVSHTITQGVLDAPVVKHIDIGCRNNNSQGTIIIETAADFYSIDSGATWSTSNTFTNLTEGSYPTKIKSIMGCVSPAFDVPISMNVVAPPSVSDVWYCQNSTAAALIATGENISWYDSPNSVIPLKGAPVPSTSQVSVTSYYASQTINDCEGPRVAVQVTILILPDAPTTDDVSIVYCQDEPTYPLVVSGVNLTWYNAPTGGIGSNNAPAISSNTPGTFNYFVSQRMENCESARTKIEVIINPTPPKPVTDEAIVYKQYTAPLPLIAYGENLQWYNSDNELLEVRPEIFTNKLGTVNYFVTQTIKGCESPAASITVETTYNYISIKHPLYFTPNSDGIWY